ncbi:MAG: serine hydrolase, partial [Balneolales bacterium]
LVKNISGMSLREYTEKHFFEPLGMSSTHFHDDTGMIVPNRVISYRPMEYGVGQFYRTNADKVGARGLFTTIEDMALWDRNFIENKTKLKNFNERMTQAGYTRRGHKINYASGLRLEWYRTLKTVGHAGNYMGFRTSYMRFPDHELSVITFCNMSSINPTSYSREVADLYLEEEFTNIYQTYAGQYRNEQSGTNQEVLFEDGDIYLKKGFNHKERLVWKSNNDFKAGHWDVQFKRNRFGQIRSLHIKTPQTGAITFKKVTEL